MKKLTYIIIIHFFAALVAYAQQPTLEWAARYLMPPNNGANKTHLALDKLGFIYVAGELYEPSTERDIILIKYDENGDTVWTKRYNNVNNTEFLYGLAVDSAGNAYITGSSGTGFGATKILILKYSPTGILLWEKLYTEPGSSSQSPGDIKLDRQGNIYVCGGYWYSGQPVSGITIKLNPAGDTLWTRRKTASGFEYTENFLAIDSTNNVLIGGLSTFIQTSQRAHLVIKYDPAGNEVWNVTSQRSGLTGTQGLAVDANGNSYLACSRTDYILIKYSPNGSELWEANYNGPGNQGDYPTDIAIDNIGNIYLTGYSNGIGTGTFDYATVKFTPSGDTVWSQRFNGTNNAADIAYSIAIDEDNNIYVTGSAHISGTGVDFITIKYSSGGSQIWLIPYNSVASGEDIAYNIILDLSNSIYITGTSSISSTFDILTLKYTQSVGINPVTGLIPNNFSLYQNFPNPFNPLTKINYALPNDVKVSIKVYDILGRLVKTLVNEFKSAGSYTVTFDGTGLASGIYFYKIEAGDFVQSKKMVLIK